MFTKTDYLLKKLQKKTYNMLIPYIMYIFIINLNNNKIMEHIRYKA